MIHTYWQASRAPRYSLLFALPLLIIYQVLAAIVPPGPGGLGIRNGADVLLEAVFTWLAGVWGPRLFMLCLIGAGAWLIAKDIRANRGTLKPAFLPGMLLESVCLSLVFGIVVGGLTAALLGAPPPPMSLGLSGQQLGRWTLLMLSIGAGIYEELLFSRRVGRPDCLGRRQAARLAAPGRGHRRYRARRVDLLRFPLYRPVWRSPGRLFLCIPHHRRTLLQRSLPAAGVRHNCLDPRTLRRFPVAALVRFVS